MISVLVGRLSGCRSVRVKVTKASATVGAVLAVSGVSANAIEDNSAMQMRSEYAFFIRIPFFFQCSGIKKPAPGRQSRALTSHVNRSEVLVCPSREGTTPYRGAH